MWRKKNLYSLHFCCLLATLPTTCTFCGSGVKASNATSKKMQCFIFPGLSRLNQGGAHISTITVHPTYRGSLLNMSTIWVWYFGALQITNLLCKSDSLSSRSIRFAWHRLWVRSPSCGTVSIVQSLVSFVFFTEFHCFFHLPCAPHSLRNYHQSAIFQHVPSTLHHVIVSCFMSACCLLSVLLVPNAKGFSDDVEIVIWDVMSYVSCN